MSRAKVVQFFATRGDLEPGVRGIDAKHSLKLIEDRYYDGKPLPALGSLSSIPRLGEVSGRRSPRFVVLDTEDRVRARRVVQIGKPSDMPRSIAMGMAVVGIRPPGGRVVYEIRPVDHPSSIEFSPGGLWNPRTLIAGEITTMHETAASKELHGLFCKELLRGFAKVKSFLVGPEAMTLLKSGCRLTVDAKAGAILDLVMD
jgi:hypothetical protein